MKSIYSKLIFGFFVTIVASFSVAGFVSLKSTNEELESTVEQDLISTREYVIKILENDDVINKEEIFDLYARSSQFSISYYSPACGYKAYGKLETTPTLQQMEKMYKTSKNKNVSYAKGNVLSYTENCQINGIDYFICIQKDTSDQKTIFTKSVILILGCVFFIGSVVFLVVAEIIVRPITRLTNATKELSNGNYSVRVDTVGEDEISKLNESFNRMAIQFAKQDETRQKFISDISHEFQTPLTSIQGFANILKEEDLPKEQREKYANIILYNSKRLSTLTKNMLQLTLLDRDEIVLEFAHYSLVDQLKRIVSTQEAIAANKDIEIKFDIPKKDIIINADEQRMEQVWTNIISNAIKYTNEGGLITIAIKKGKEIEVEIEDTGIGMSKEVISHIFERFYREDKARNVEGNGLGLSIVKRIVDLHNGKIEVESTVDVGTIFRVKMPLEKGHLRI